MKAAGLRNALLFFVGGLIAWGLLIWLPHRELGRLSGYLGRPENLPPISQNVYSIHWAARGPRGRMLFHNIALLVVLLVLYGFLIYNVVGVRVAMRGIAV